MNLTPQQKVLSNNKQQAKLAWKRKQVMQLADRIREDITSYGVQLPETLADYDGQKAVLLGRAGYDVDEELLRGWDSMHDEIIRLHYSLKRTNKAIYAMFENKGVCKPQLVSAWYTKHRLDAVWLWRKSQLIRSIYRDYLQTAMVGGKLLIKQYTPLHITLTVPHNIDGYKGKRFYARELLKCFHEVRRTKFWKQYIYGGEYGLEITKSNENGLHIHIHSLSFLSPDISINNFRAWLRQKWEDVTGATFIHVEQLYHYKRNNNGTYEMTESNKPTVIFDDETGTAELQPRMVRKKFYIGKDSSIEDYISGVMECIKYHFKSDTYQDDNGDYDLELIRDILNNSKHLRFYSRFGAFYGEKALNFDRLESIDETEIEAIEGAEETLNGSAAKGERELVNPFTFEPAQPEQYYYVIARPESLKYTRKDDIKPYDLITYGREHFLRICKNATIQEIVQHMVTGKLDMILADANEAHRYRRKRQYYLTA
jgi:hypothetical protein